jgi:hypothetical protein
MRDRNGQVIAARGGMSPARASARWAAAVISSFALACSSEDSGGSSIRIPDRPDSGAESGGQGGFFGVLPGGSSGGGMGGAAGALGIGGNGGTPAVSECERRTAVLSGTLGASPWDPSFAIDPKFVPLEGANPPGFAFFYQLDEDGFLLLRGRGDAPARDGTAHPADVLLLLPTGTPDPLAWYCGNQGSTVESDAVETRVDLRGLGRLATCADGVPVSGEVVICKDGFASDCNFTRSGTLDGIAIPEDNWIGTGGTYLDEVSIAYPDGMIVRYTRLGHHQDTGALVDAFILTDPAGPWGGAIYCAGPDSEHIGRSTVRNTNILKSLVRLPNCAGIEGSTVLSGCVGAQ